MIWQLMSHYLHKHNELCVAGLGRFVADPQEFSVDPVAKKIIPSYRKFHFEPGDFQNSPDFIRFIHLFSKEEPSAIVEKLSSLSHEFQTALVENKKLEIEHFGVFRFQESGNPDFELTAGDTFDEHSFGLKPVHFAANLLKTKRIVVENKEEVEEVEIKQMRESALKELKVLLDNARIAESKQVQKKSNVFPIIASALTLILLVNLGFFLYKGPVDQIKQQISEMNILGKTGEILDTQKAEIVVNTPVEPVKPLPPIDLEPEPMLVDETPSMSLDSLASHVSLAFTRGPDLFDSTLYTPNLQLAEVTEPVIEKPVETVKETEYRPSPVISNMDHLSGLVNVDAKINGVEKGYYVVVGAFRIESNAIRMKANLIQNGYPQAILFKPLNSPYFMVSFERSLSRNQAISILEKNRSEQPGIWVYQSY